MKIGRSVWYCSKLNTQSASGEDYGSPIEIKTRMGYFTVMGKKGASYIIDLGDTTSSELTCIAQPYEMWENVFHEGDLFYCNGVMPSDVEQYNGQNANYVVDDIDFGNRRIKLTLKRVRQ